MHRAKGPFTPGVSDAQRARFGIEHIKINETIQTGRERRGRQPI